MTSNPCKVGADCVGEESVALDVGPGGDDAELVADDGEVDIGAESSDEHPDMHSATITPVAAIA
jgi:hypothetical protein